MPRGGWDSFDESIARVLAAPLKMIVFQLARNCSQEVSLTEQDHSVEALRLDREEAIAEANLIHRRLTYW